ncbi:MAG: hypothetical protein K6G24_08665 [Lachnospiraceae bacterium]|nr:hypothetical protein [Lachnospiraceae bacterium]
MSDAQNQADPEAIERINARKEKAVELKHSGYNCCKYFEGLFCELKDRRRLQ